MQAVVHHMVGIEEVVTPGAAWTHRATTCDPAFLQSSRMGRQGEHAPGILESPSKGQVFAFNSDQQKDTKGW